MQKYKSHNYYRYNRRQNTMSNHSTRLNPFTKIISTLPIITLFFTMLGTSFTKAYLKYFNLDPDLTPIITKPTSIPFYFLIAFAVSLALIIYFYWINQQNKKIKNLLFILPTITPLLLSILGISYLKFNKLLSNIQSLLILIIVLIISFQIFVITLFFNSIAKDIKEMLELNKFTLKTHNPLSSLNLLIGILFIVIGVLFLPASVQPLGEIAAKYKKSFTIFNDNQVIVSYVQQKALTLPAEINDNHLIIYTDRGYSLSDLTDSQQVYKKFKKVILCTESSEDEYCKSE